jgi:hypothetical protein
MTTETIVEPQLADAPPCWPPKAHIRDKRKGPLKDGALALCGAKLMGLDLEGTSVNNVCKECVEIARRELGL